MSTKGQVGDAINHNIYLPVSKMDVALDPNWLQNIWAFVRKCLMWPVDRNSSSCGLATTSQIPCPEFPCPREDNCGPGCTKKASFLPRVVCFWMLIINHSEPLLYKYHLLYGNFFYNLLMCLIFHKLLTCLICECDQLDFVVLSTLHSFH